MARTAFVLWTALCLALIGCQFEPGDGSEGPKPEDGAPFAQLELALEDLPLKLDRGGSTPPSCTDPRPPDQGCTILCKPCKTAVCIDGEWEIEDLDWPDGVCDGPNIDLGDDPFACPRGAGNFCPAECSFCF